MGECKHAFAFLPRRIKSLLARSFLSLATRCARWYQSQCQTAFARAAFRASVTMSGDVVVDVVVVVVVVVGIEIAVGGVMEDWGCVCVGVGASSKCE